MNGLASLTQALVDDSPPLKTRTIVRLGLAKEWLYVMDGEVEEAGVATCLRLCGSRPGEWGILGETKKAPH